MAFLMVFKNVLSITHSVAAGKKTCFFAGWSHRLSLHFIVNYFSRMALNFMGSISGAM